MLRARPFFAKFHESNHREHHRKGVVILLHPGCLESWYLNDPRFTKTTANGYKRDHMILAWFLDIWLYMAWRFEIPLACSQFQSLPVCSLHWHPSPAWSRSPSLRCCHRCPRNGVWSWSLERARNASVNRKMLLLGADCHSDFQHCNCCLSLSTRGSVYRRITTLVILAEQHIGCHTTVGVGAAFNLKALHASGIADFAGCRIAQALQAGTSAESSSCCHWRCSCHDRQWPWSFMFQHLYFEDLAAVPNVLRPLEVARVLPMSVLAEPLSINHYNFLKISH